jgi:outer membrane protein assembly factor BamD
MVIAAMTILSCSTDKAAVKDSPLVPDVEMKKANELIDGGYYEEAREILEKIRVNDTAGDYAILARLRVADTYYEDESYEEAVVEYESFLDIYPYHKYASYAQYKLAMCYFKRVKTVDVSYSWASRALSEFRKLQQTYPRNPYMNIIDNRVQSCQNVLAEYEYYVGNFYFEKGSYEAAIGRFDGLVDTYPVSSIVPEAIYYSGLSHENLGQREKATEKLSLLIQQYPTLELSAEARKLIDSFQ